MARSAARPVTTLSTVIRSLSAESDAACLLDAQGTYLFVNGAWDRLVAAQGGAEQGDQLVGRSWIDRYAGGDLKRIHAQLLERVVRGEGTGPGRAVVLVEEHNTPTRARLFATRLQPVETGGELLGVAVVQRLVRERPIDEVYGAVDRPEDAYREPSGAVAQCGCCGRVRDPLDPARWDLVPALLEKPPECAAQVLCDLCAELHYGLRPEA